MPATGNEVLSTPRLEEIDLPEILKTEIKSKDSDVDTVANFVELFDGYNELVTSAILGDKNVYRDLGTNEDTSLYASDLNAEITDAWNDDFKAIGSAARGTRKISNKLRRVLISSRRATNFKTEACSGLFCIKVYCYNVPTLKPKDFAKNPTDGISEKIKDLSTFMDVKDDLEVCECASPHI